MSPHSTLAWLRQSVARYALAGIDAEVTCTWRLSRRVWDDMPSYGLSYLAATLKLDLDHHDAGSDSLACAGVALAMAAAKNALSLRDLLRELESAPARVHASSFVGLPIPTRSPTGNTIDVSGRNAEGDPDADPNHPLYGLTVCFTSGMLAMTRNEAVAAILPVGANYNKGMSKNVDILVVGDADFVAFADGMQTSKMSGAITLREKGEDIETVAERDFLNLLY